MKEKEKNQIEGFPKEIIEKMLERQVEQGNKRDITVFERNNQADRGVFGFTWEDTTERYFFWKSVIREKDFSLFFSRYPKVAYPKVMEVSSNSDFTNSSIRVVFAEKYGIFIAWSDATTIKEAEKSFSACGWKYARDIIDDVEVTLEEIAKWKGVKVENLKIKQ